SRRNRSKPQKARKAPSTHRRNGGVKAEKLAAHNENATPKADFFNTIGEKLPFNASLLCAQ
ncbi:MAG: hypothetical protein AAGA09_09410, partial [Pseudomonadota bacterium]